MSRCRLAMSCCQLFGVSRRDSPLAVRSTMLETYGTRLLGLPACDESNVYQERYKGITTCFNMLRWSLTGEYVNFGVFRLYGTLAAEPGIFTPFFWAGADLFLSDLTLLPRHPCRFRGRSIGSRSADLLQTRPDRATGRHPGVPQAVQGVLLQHAGHHSGPCRLPCARGPAPV